MVHFAYAEAHTYLFARQDDIARTDVKFRREFDDEAFDSTGLRDTFGPSPSPLAVDIIVKRAAKCQKKEYNETAWFTLVHSHLLLLALENETYEDEVDFVPW
jgi:hypothetical protein